MKLTWLKWIVSLLLGFCGHSVEGQTVFSYERANDSLILDSLRTAFGNKKILPASVELQTLRALSHYPELQDIQIEFVLCRQKTAHSSQPKISILLRSAKERHYQIKISTEVPDFFRDGMQSSLPYNAQIGVLGHELGHTVQYLRRRFFGLLCEGIRYGTSKKYVIATEHHTDEIAIDHGLGWQLLAWAKIARPMLEQAGRGQNYMLPEEIEGRMGR